ncbi:chemotaxis protein CheX [Sporomusa aerivorans]|uniref:chemotaxis protein CheX n=1 Tax=Sporomusa aerivorans TaxID=204936 RepID=UPI00352B3718
MLHHSLGNYLLNTGLLTYDQLCEILRQEHAVKVRLGTLAVNAGLMTAAQVEEVHSLQRIKDQKFGTLAESLGYLTHEQVEALLTIQGKGNLSLMQAITDKGFMTLAELEKALADFRAEYCITEQDQAAADTLVLKKLVDFSAAGDKAELLYYYLGLTLRNIVRFLDATPYISGTGNEVEQTPAYFVSQPIHGDISLMTGLCMGEAVLLELASRFYGEKLTAVTELALDSAGEFINVHNGVFCTTLSNEGIVADLGPQAVHQSGLPATCRTYRAGIGTSFGPIELILTI